MTANKKYLAVGGFKHYDLVNVDCKLCDSFDEALEYVKSYGYIEIVENEEFNTNLIDLVRDYFFNSWNARTVKETVYLFVDEKKEEYQFFDNIYLLMCLVERYGLKPEQDIFSTEDGNYILAYIPHPVIQDKLCRKYGYRKVEHVGLKGV